MRHIRDQQRSVFHINNVTFGENYHFNLNNFTLGSNLVKLLTPEISLHIDMSKLSQLFVSQYN